jgi:hypothetical protein
MGGGGEDKRNVKGNSMNGTRIRKRNARKEEKERQGKRIT